MSFRMYNLNGMLGNMYSTTDQPIKYFVATIKCDQFDSLDKILTETNVKSNRIILKFISPGPRVPPGPRAPPGSRVPPSLRASSGSRAPPDLRVPLGSRAPPGSRVSPSLIAPPYSRASWLKSATWFESAL